MKKKSAYTSNRIDEIIEKIKKFSEIVEPRKKINIVRDGADNKIIEAAVEGKCSYIVTGDKDLLTLKKYKRIKIVSAKEFLEEFATR